MTIVSDAIERIERQAARKRIKQLIVFLSFCSLFLGPRLNAENGSDASQQLVRAADLADLRKTGSQPFELDASIEVLDNNGRSFRGTYQLQWSSANRWRESITLPGYQRTRIGGERKEWRQRSINFELPQVWHLDAALDFPRRLRDSAAKVSSKLKTEKLGQVNSECAYFKHDFDEEDFCFDPTRGVLVGEKLPHGASGGEENVRGREYSNFIEFGDKLFPGSIQIVAQDKTLLTFSDVKLIPLAQTSSADFVAPPGAEEWTTCDQPEKPKVKKQIPPVYPSDAKLNHEQGRVVFYALIGADGVVHNLKLIQSASPLLDDAASKAVSQWQYEPRKCGGVAAPVETFIDVIFDIN